MVVLDVPARGAAGGSSDAGAVAVGCAAVAVLAEVCLCPLGHMVGVVSAARRVVGCVVLAEAVGGLGVGLGEGVGDVFARVAASEDVAVLLVGGGGGGMGGQVVGVMVGFVRVASALLVYWLV